jgi:hypothetical protein
VRERVVDHAVIDAIPASPTPYHMAALVPGVTTSSANGGAYQDVGNSQAGSGSNTLTIHGRRPDSLRVTYNGIHVGTLQAGTNAGHVTNIQAFQEVTIDTAAVSAELSTGGIRINLIPREGGNTFRGVLFATSTSEGMQGNNFSADLRARGLRSPDKVKRIWDVNPGIGGPIRKDRVWFYATARHNGAETYVAEAFSNLTAGNPNVWTYAPDLNSRPFNSTWQKDAQVRLTWQATPKNKLAGSFDQLYQCTCPTSISASTAPESAQPWAKFRPKYQVYVDWTAPATNRLLFEAVAFRQYEQVARIGQSASQLNAVTEQSTGRTYRAIAVPGAGNPFNQNWAYRASASYVTGSHSVKVGVINIFGRQDTRLYNVDSPVSYRFNNGVPNQITLQLTPYFIHSNLDADFGLYAQDKWTIGRLTVSGGIRYDYLGTSYPDQQVGPVPLAPTLNFTIPATDGLGWKDMTPKSGLAYDLFGNGKTALKATLNKYVQGQALSNGIFGQPMNPISRLVTNTTRSWTDANRDFVPNCDLTNPAANGECGAMANASFGRQRQTTVYDPAVTTGWGHRNYNWEFTTTVQHEVLPRVSAEVGYFRRWYGNLVVTDNRAVSASDYTQFSITAPVDPRLPNGGGYTVSGVYDLSPNKVGQVDNVLTFSENYGSQIEHWDGIDLTVNARLRDGLLVLGGLSSGRLLTDNCEVVARVPEALFGTTDLLRVTSGNAWQPAQWCRQAEPMLTHVKLLGTYTIPKADVVVSATYQGIPGREVVANYVATSTAVAPALGRNLSGNAANITVNIVEPKTMYGDRLHQLDLRFGKVLRLGRTRTTVNLDIYNALNADTVLTENSNFATWRRPTSILLARFAKVGFQVDF